MGVDRYSKEQMERLRDHKVPFDQEAMWSAIQQKKKKRRGAFFFLTMALVALAIVFLAYQVIGWQINVVNKVSDANSERSSQEINRTTQNDSETSSGEMVTQGFTISKENSEKSKSELNANEADDRKVAYVAEEGINPKAKVSGSENQDVEIVRNKSLDVNVNTVTNDLSNVTQQQASSESTSISNSSASENTNIRSPLDANNETKISPEESVDKSLFIPILQNYQFPFLESIFKKEIDFADLEMSPSPIIEPLKTSTFSIGIYGGVGYANRTLELESVIDPTQPIDLKGRTLEEVSLGLELKYQITPRYYIRSGLEYWHVTDQKDRVSISVSELNDSTDLFEDQTGFVLNINTSRKHTMYQTYNVPVLFGLNSNNKRFNYFAEAGAMVNLSLATRGDRPNISEITGVEHILESDFQIAPLVGIGASYTMTNDVELFTSASWRGNQMLTAKPQLYDLYSKQGYSALRMQLGVRKKF